MLALNEKWYNLRSVYAQERSLIVGLVGFAIIFSMFCAGLMTFPASTWSLAVAFKTFSLSFVILLGMLFMCVPNDVLSNSLVRLFSIKFALCGWLMVGVFIVISKNLYGY